MAPQAAAAAGRAAHAERALVDSLGDNQARSARKATQPPATTPRHLRGDGMSAAFPSIRAQEGQMNPCPPTGGVADPCDQGRPGAHRDNVGRKDMPERRRGTADRRRRGERRCSGHGGDRFRRRFRPKDQPIATGSPHSPAGADWLFPRSRPGERPAVSPATPGHASPASAANSRRPPPRPASWSNHTPRVRSRATEPLRRKRNSRRVLSRRLGSPKARTARDATNP